MTFAIAFSRAASEAKLRPPTPAGEAVEAGHPDIGEGDTNQQQRGQADPHQSLVTEYCLSVRLLSLTAGRRYCSSAKIKSGSLRALNSESRSLFTWRPRHFQKWYFMKFFYEFLIHG